MYRNFLRLVELPVVIECSYALSDSGDEAMLSLHGMGSNTLHVTIVHEGVNIAKYEMRGDEASERLIARTGEAVLINARCEGSVVACGLYEVALERMEALLIPLVSAGIVLSQHCDNSVLVDSMEVMQ